MQVDYSESDSASERKSDTASEWEPEEDDNGSDNDDRDSDGIIDLVSSSDDAELQEVILTEFQHAGDEKENRHPNIPTTTTTRTTTTTTVALRISSSSSSSWSSSPPLSSGSTHSSSSSSSSSTVVTVPTVVPARQALHSVNFKRQFMDQMRACVARQVAHLSTNWRTMFDEIDTTKDDQIWQWWGRARWEEMLHYVEGRIVSITDPGLHGCVILRRYRGPSHNYATCFTLAKEYNLKVNHPFWYSALHGKGPPPADKKIKEEVQTFQIYRLLPWLWETDPALRYAIGHPNQPVRTEATRQEQDLSPLALVHLCNNGDSGCINPEHIWLSDAIENGSRNACKGGRLIDCPHTPPCVFVVRKTGAIIPKDNLSDATLRQLYFTHSDEQLRNMSYAEWLSLKGPNIPRPPWLLPRQRTTRKRNRIRTQSDAGKERRAKLKAKYRKAHPNSPDRSNCRTRRE